MDLKDLRYAIAVADEGSFTRAAARLHLAQQALSKQIGDLERELDVRLFVRMPRGTRVTAAGAAFVEAGRATLAQSQLAMAHARSTDRREMQILRVGLLPGPTLAEAAVAPLRSLRERHGLVRIEVVETSALALRRAIRDGVVDLAIVSSPPDDSAEIAGECVWQRPLGAVLPTAHPVAAREIIRLRELIDLPLITFGREVDPLGYDWLARALARRGLKARFADVCASEPELVGPFVAAGEGWTLATADGAWPVYARMPGVVFRRFADEPILEQRWILWPYSEPSPLVGPFIALWKRVHGVTVAEGDRDGEARCREVAAD